jgi:hypothetical protein
MAGKFGLDPHRLDDETLEREHANRFPERTRADALRTRKGARIQAGQPTATPRTPKSTTRRTAGREQSKRRN